MIEDELDARYAAIEAQNIAAAEPEPAEPVEAPVAAHTDETTEVEADAAQEPSEVKEPVDDEEAERQARLERIFFEKRDAVREARRLAAENEVLRGNRVESRDESIAREAERQARELAQVEIVRRESSRVKANIEKSFGDAQPIIAAFEQAIGQGGVPTEFLQATIEAAPGDEHKVLQWLSRNPDEIERIAGLSPLLQGAAISKIAAKVNTPKPVSKAPAPIRPVGGSVKSVEAPVKDFGKMSPAEQILFYDDQDRKARLARFG